MADFFNEQYKAHAAIGSALAGKSLQRYTAEQIEAHERKKAEAATDRERAFSKFKRRIEELEAEEAKKNKAFLDGSLPTSATTYSRYMRDTFNHFLYASEVKSALRDATGLSPALADVADVLLRIRGI